MGIDLTRGKISKGLIFFSLPMIWGNLFQQVYNICDTLIVGRTIGAYALVAVGSSYALMVLLSSVIIGFTMGAGVVFSQLYGAGRLDDMKVSIVNAFGFILLVALIVNALAFALLDHFIVWLNIPTEATKLTEDYMWAVFWGIIFVFIYNFLTAIFRSVGNTIVPLVFLVMAAILNILLDLLFILKFNMGVAGAAWATVVSQGLSAFSMIFYFFLKGHNVMPTKKSFRMDKSILKSIAENSTLTAIQQSIMNLGILMVQGLVNSFGYVASAAFATVVKIDGFAYMPAQDFGNAFATFTAQNYGAGQKDRIKKGLAKAVAITTIFCLISSAIVNIFARDIIGWFVKGNPADIIEVGVEYLRIEGSLYIGIGILFLWYGYFRGIGRGEVSIVLTVISLGTRVLLAYLLSSIPGVGLIGVWASVPIGWALADLYGWFVFRRQIAKDVFKCG